MFLPVKALIGISIAIARPQSYLKSALTFGPPVAATAQMDCPGIRSFTVPLSQMGDYFFMPPLPELFGFSSVGCLATITWEDANGATETSEMEIDYVKLNTGFLPE